MNKRVVLVAAFVSILLLGASARPLTAQDSDAKKPNIVLVIGDDMTWWDCEPYGSTQVKTPNLARLATEGMSFDFAFTATAMCAPTRQQLFTGMWPVRNGAYPNHSRVHDGVKSFVHHFNEIGYRVGLAGKSHCKPKASFPWEQVCAKDLDFDAIDAFMGRDDGEPFFLVVASNEPHKPWNKGDVDQYPTAEIEVPPTMVDTPSTREALAQYFAEITYLDWQLGQVDELLHKHDLSDDTILIFTSEQGSQLPFGGKWTCYEAGLRTALIARWPNQIQAGSRCDAMVQYIDIIPTLLDTVGVDPESIDTGRDGSPNGDRGFDGTSFKSVVTGEAAKHRDFVFGVHTTRGIINGSEAYGIRSVRSTRFKYILNLNHDQAFTNIETDPERSGVLSSWRESGVAGQHRADAYQHRPEIEFYDLEQDPFELNNLAEDPEFVSEREMLARELSRWMEQQGDEGKETELAANSRQR